VNSLKVSRILIICALLAFAVALSAFPGCSCSEPEEHVHQPTSRYATLHAFPNQDLVDVPLYNNKVVGYSVKASADKTDGVYTRVNINYATGDEYDDVTKWYEGKLGAPTTSETNQHGEQETRWVKTGNGYTTTVRVYHSTSGGGDVHIDVTKEKSS
jgi:hypothetical protein